MARGIRDLILFFVFAGVPIVSFWLQNYPDTPFYAGMLVIFLVTLMWLRQYGKEDSYRMLVTYDENLHTSSFLWIAVGILSVFIISSVITRSYASSSIWVPSHNLEMTYLASFQLSGFWNDVLFQLVLVAPAEELCKLGLHLAFYLKLKETFSEGIARMTSIALPIALWAVLHSYRAYVGPNQLELMFAAFVGGLVIFGVMYKTKSLMSAILVHSGYNIGVLMVMQGLLH